MKQLWEGVFAKNPVLVLALGLVPAVAITTTAMNGLVLGIVAALVLTAAAIINWVLIPHVPANAKLPVRVLVLILLVVAAYSLLLSQNPGFVASLGIFLPLIAFDDLLLRAGDEDSSFSGAVLKACGQGLGFTLVLLVLGIIREFLALGSIFGRQIVSGALAPLSLAGSVPGGMVILGLLLALVNLVTKRGGELHD
jgi:electron transport complex protein RnfE